jgi:hypothetical protein
MMLTMRSFIVQTSRTALSQRCASAALSNALPLARFGTAAPSGFRFVTFYLVDEPHARLKTDIPFDLYLTL